MVQASNRETYGRLKGRRSIDRLVGRYTRSVDRYTRYLVNEIVRLERGYRLVRASL